MEIKVGDKVRVSGKLPRIYERFGSWIAPHYECEVVEIEEGMALLDSIPDKHVFLFPLKYLTKVNAEAKEPKFNAGEIVRYRYDGKLYIVECKTGKYYYALRQVGGDVMMHDVLESDLELVTEPKQEIKVGDVIDTPKGEGTVRISYGDYWVVQLDNGEWYIHMETNMPYAPYTEPTAPKIEVGDFVRVLENLHEPFCLDVERHLEITNIPPHAVSQKKWKVISIEVRRDCAGCIYTLKHDDSFIYNIPEDCVERVEPTEQTEAEKKPNVGSIKIPVEVDLTDSYWNAYTADLAKEIVLKVANKYSDPTEAADYAVSVAKAVVENLKKK